MVEFTPDGIAERSFRTTLRGFDQSEVREFLAQLSGALAELVTERDRLAATLQAGDAKDLQAEIDLVSNEIRSVLETARSAAESMRERAAAETARWRSEAIAEAERTRREAEADAEHLRTDAWTTSESLLSQVQREVTRLREESEKESMRLVGEAEREAHRTLGAGRREAEEAVRTARMEAEKLVLDARASHDEIIETANRKAEVAQERTRALEQRRDELRRELDSVRSAIAAVESELDERRGALELTATAPEQASVEPVDQWVPGETVRVVRPGHPESGADETAVVSEPRPRPDPTPELRVLSPDELRSRHHPSATPAAATQETVADVTEDRVTELLEEEDVTDREEVTASLPPTKDTEVPSEEAVTEAAVTEEPVTDEAVTDEPVTDEPVTDEAVTAKAGDTPTPVVEESPATAKDRSEHVDTPAAPAEEFADVEGLFARLREPVSTEPAASSVSHNGVEAHSSEPADPAAPTIRTLDVDPFDVRDSLLLPISNRALRNVKRQLTEEQNAALERIRIDHTAWEPDAEALEASLKPDLVVLAAESFAAGHAAAESLTSQKLTRPGTPSQAIAGRIVAALTADLLRALEDGRAHDHGARQIAADVSRVFRAWRTDESERRIRHFAYMSYNRGLVESVPDDQGTHWVVAGRGCAVCRDLGGRDVVDDPPPAHEGCACTVVPL
ncbi:MAG: DivIVA domain-containing protein [Acidimicrobiia bacterium]